MKADIKSPGTNGNLFNRERDMKNSLKEDCMNVLCEKEYKITQENKFIHSFIHSFIYFSFCKSIQGSKQPKVYRTCHFVNNINIK